MHVTRVVGREGGRQLHDDLAAYGSRAPPGGKRRLIRGGGGGGGNNTERCSMQLCFQMDGTPKSAMNFDPRIQEVVYSLPLPGLKCVCPQWLLMTVGAVVKNMIVSTQNRSRLTDRYLNRLTACTGAVGSKHFSNTSSSPCPPPPRRSSNSRHHSVNRHARRFIHCVHRQSPFQLRFHYSPGPRVRMALPHPTPVNNIPDRSLRWHAIEVSPQSTVLVTGDEPVPNKPNKPRLNRPSFCR